MSEFQYPFEKLRVFQKSRELAALIYRHTRQFPQEERFGLVNQMRRASVSILSNLAEGSARISKREQARFTEIAYSSASELAAQCIIALDLQFLNQPSYSEIRSVTAEVTSMLAGLRKAQAQELQEPEAPYFTESET